MSLTWGTLIQARAARKLNKRGLAAGCSEFPHLYQYGNISRPERRGCGATVVSPARDATAIAKMFRDAGFDSVDLLLNVGNLEFKRAIRKFETAADQADIAVVYYAGHGLEISGTNYLIPIDARLASDRDADDEAIPLERLVSSADGARRPRLVILDACRDNPFVSTRWSNGCGASQKDGLPHLVHLFVYEGLKRDAWSL